MVKKNERRILQTSSPGAALQMPACGRLHRRIQEDNRTGFSQTLGEFHVFHERVFAKAAKFSEMFGANEDGLVAEERTVVLIPPPFEMADPGEGGVAFVKGAVKGAAHQTWVFHTGSN